MESNIVLFHLPIAWLFPRCSVESPPAARCHPEVELQVPPLRKKTKKSEECEGECVCPEIWQPVTHWAWWPLTSILIDPVQEDVHGPHLSDQVVVSVQPQHLLTAVLLCLSRDKQRASVVPARNQTQQRPGVINEVVIQQILCVCERKTSLTRFYNVVWSSGEIREWTIIVVF